jgi:hypothetical protein
VFVCVLFFENFKDFKFLVKKIFSAETCSNLCIIHRPDDY